MFLSYGHNAKLQFIRRSREEALTLRGLRERGFDIGSNLTRVTLIKQQLQQLKSIGHEHNML